MNKREATLIINKEYGKDILNYNKNGNVKFANKNSKKNVYWINIHIDSRLDDTLHIVLNDKDKRKLTYLIIPPNTLKSDLFKVRIDKTNGLQKMDIELSNDVNNYLIDIKSGGSNYDFSKYISKIFRY